MVVGDASIGHSHSDPVGAIRRPLYHYMSISYLYPSSKGVARTGKTAGRGQRGRFARDVISRPIWGRGGVVYL